MTEQAPLLRLTGGGACDRRDAAVTEAADTFRRQQCLRLPALLDPVLLASVQNGIERGRFFTKHHGDAATELCLEPDATVGLLHFLINDAVMYRLIEDLSGSPVRCFFGRVYRHVPGTDHHHAWHSDLTEHRTLGLSLNLSRTPYDGGVFEIRELGRPETTAAVANLAPGDAVLFRLGERLEHRITPVTGHSPKTAFAGWFRLEPDYLATLRASLHDHDPAR